MPDLSGDREWIVVAICGIVILVAVSVVVIGFSLEAVTITLLYVAVLFGSMFGKLKDTWNAGRPFSPARVFFAPLNG